MRGISRNIDQMLTAVKNDKVEPTQPNMQPTLSVFFNIEYATFRKNSLYTTNIHG
jgi:hypothetical protein